MGVDLYDRITRVSPDSYGFTERSKLHGLMERSHTIISTLPNIKYQILAEESLSHNFQGGYVNLGSLQRIPIPFHGLVRIFVLHLEMPYLFTPHIITYMCNLTQKMTSTVAEENGSRFNSKQQFLVPYAGSLTPCSFP